MGYFKWFFNTGFKQYAVGFLFSIFFTIMYFYSLDDIFGAPMALTILISISKFAFDIGIISHSVMTYKASCEQ